MIKTASNIRFTAKLLRPAAAEKAATWTFLRVPRAASEKLPARSMTSVNGTLNGASFQATLEPDGQGSHWLKVEKTLRDAAGANVGDTVQLEIAPVEVEPEPKVPPELKRALAASPKAMALWTDITPVARRDWIHWITSAKQAETRARRIEVACSKLEAGKRRACCFDRSGMYSKSMSCPLAEGEETVTKVLKKVRAQSEKRSTAKKA